MKERLNETNINNFGSRMQIIRYGSYNDIDVLFIDYNWIFKRANYGNFKKGNTRCPYEETVLKKGYLGEGIYKCDGKNRVYKTWSSIITRCYSYKYQLSKPTYKGCAICDEWFNFQNFAKWYEENFYEIEDEEMHLDKDILFKNNKIYSPETCVFVPKRINSLLGSSESKRGDLPIGVNLDRNRFRARVCNILTKQRINIGGYGTKEEAFNNYKLEKEKIIKQVADHYKNKIPKKLYDALYRYEVEITD